MPVKPDRKWVEQRLDILYPKHTEEFAKLLITLRRLFDGDMDQMLILAILGSGLRGDKWLENLLHRPINRALIHTNTQSISEISGIPRESVRRKLALMQDKGLVERNKDGSWKVGLQASVLLREGTVATIDYLAAILKAAFHAEGRT